MKVSVIIPCYNECTTIGSIVAAVRAVALAFRRSAVAGLQICEDRFGFEPEITAKLARAKRTYEEGKKIGWKDGFRALYAILKYNFFAREPSRLTAAVVGRQNSVPLPCERELPCH